jgi:hypothetical protein
MANPQATVPIMVAVIGVIGAILPIYISNVIIRDDNYPDIDIQVKPVDIRSPLFTQFAINITNSGNAPATNLSAIVNAFPVNIVNITNKFSTTDIILPQFNNTVLRPGVTQTINHSLLEIQIPKLIHGMGSIVELEVFIDNLIGQGRVYAVYDQGSDQGEPLRPRPLSMADLFSESYERLGAYYVVFYVALFGLLYLYIRRRKSMKRSLTKVVKNIMEIRGALRNDRSNKTVFPEIWYNISEEKRQDNHNIGDYLLIDDFYSELSKRNLYLSLEKESAIDEGKVLRHNETCLAAAEKVLKDIEWNKYR